MKSKKSKPKSNGYNPDISFGRLGAMIAAIDSGNLDSDCIAEVRDTLCRIYAVQVSEKIAVTKGRPRSRMPTIYIWLHELLSVHNVTPKSALLALAPSPECSDSQRETIKREYRDKKKGSFPPLDSFTKSVIADIAETNCRKKRGK